MILNGNGDSEFEVVRGINYDISVSQPGNVPLSTMYQFDSPDSAWGFPHRRQERVSSASPKEPWRLIQC